MAWPVDPLDVQVGLQIGGTWVDAVATGNGVREADKITLSYGRSNWASQVDPGRATFTLDNRDGRWSPDNPTGPHYGNLRRNLPCRVGIGRGEIHLRPTGNGANLASTPDLGGTGGGSPTAPAYNSVTTDAETSNATTHTYSLPATVNTGDRLLLIVAAGHESLTPTDQGGGVTDLDDWTLVDSGNLYTPWHAWRIYEIEAATSTIATALAGSTVQFSTTSSVKSSCQVIRTTGARSGGLGTAWDYAGPSASTSSAAPDPPSLTTTWGADQHRWYAIAIYGSGADRVTAYPSSYTSISDSTSATNVLIATAHRTTTSATENPGAFTLAGDENWQAATFVYRAIEDSSTGSDLDITGDIDLRAEVELEQDLADIVTGGARARLAHKSSSGADGIEWEMYQANGVVVGNFTWRDSGGVAHNVTTEQTGAALPLDFQHEHRALRVTLDVDNGASGHTVTWYTGTTMGGSWTQLGSPVVTAGTTSIRTNDAPLRVGGNPADGAHIPFPGRIYAFQMRDGIGGTALADVAFNSQTVGATSFTGADGLTWTIGAGGEISNMLWRFHGEVSALPVRWNVDASDIVTTVEAAGLFRRLRQGNRRLDSAIKRAIIRTATSVVQYWPLEDDGAGITSFGAAVGTARMAVSGGTPNTGASSVFLCSDALPTLGDAALTAIVDDYTASGAWQVRWLQSCPVGFTGTDLNYIGVVTTDMTWHVRYRDSSGGQLQVLAYRGVTNVYASAWTSFNATANAFRMTLAVVQNGANVNVTLEGQRQDQASAGGFSTTSAVAGSAGRVTGITINGDSAMDTWAFGHVTLQSVKTPSTELATELAAYNGEKAGTRIIRLCREEGIATRFEGDPADTEGMGPQRPGSLMDLLQECADTDLGILHEPRETVAVGYRTRASILDQPVIVDLDYSAGELARSPELDRDDQDFANDITVVNRTGTTARAVLDDGSALSVSEPPVGAGRYDTTYRLNGQDSRLKVLADTRLALTTVDEPRVSRLPLALHHAPMVANSTATYALLDASLGDRIRVTNNLAAAVGTAEIDQIIQGTRERIGMFDHTIDCLTTPFSPWAVTGGGGGVVTPPATHSVTFRSQQTLAYSGSPPHVLTALGYTSSTAITRADLDDILDDWVAGTGGTTRNVTSAASWTTALAAAVPGDLIRVTSGFDPAGGINARGNRYGISGSNLTASPAGGSEGLPIILTCADGVYVDENNTSSNESVLDLQNCQHVWAVGFNARNAQFGMRGQNWGGSDGFPAYIAYCNIENSGHAGLQVAGWFQLITSSGGTPPSGTGNEWGYSQWVVIESNTIDGTGVIADQFGEGIYLGRGSSPGWVAYARDVWVRGNNVTDWTSDGIDVKPGCRRIFITDNEFHTGHAVLGAPMGLCYVDASIDTRPAWFALDPEIYVEGNRIYDSNVTNTNGSSVNIMGYIGLSGCRIANNVMWAKPETGTHAMWRARNEQGTDAASALATFRNDPTWVINNTCWGDDSFENAGYGNPFVGAFPGTITFDLRNNIVDQASPATGEVDASAADFIATVPAIGAAGDAEWSTYGNGSAFDLATSSALVGAGEDVSDVAFLIDRDISNRPFTSKTAPNPGAFQPFPT